MTAPQIIAAGLIIVGVPFAVWLSFRAFRRHDRIEAVRHAGDSLGISLWGLLLQWGGFW